jgi:ribosomal subunit interface protein
MELTRGINNYIDKRIISIGKFVKGGEMAVFVEVGKTTNHHKQGDIFRAEFNIEIQGSKFYAFSEKEDLYKAIDDAKKEIIRQITNSKDRKQTLLKRGASSIKNILKGFY